MTHPQMTSDPFATFQPQHRDALIWFENQAGQEMSWPQPVNGMFLVNKAKGIQKPKQIEYALSVRQSLGGPYEDVLHWTPEGSWFLNYDYESKDPDLFTNRGLKACMADGVPVGVMIQTKEKPAPRYKILGLGLITSDDGAKFEIQQYGSAVEQAETSVTIATPNKAFDATNIEDSRIRTLQAIARRRGQPAFRKALMEAYDEKCAITGCSITAILEAAHIIPYTGDHTNHVQNGLLLRADIHTLFDLGLLAIDPLTYTSILSDELHTTDYGYIHGRQLLLPKDKKYWPAHDALQSRPLRQPLTPRKLFN